MKKTPEKTKSLIKKERVALPTSTEELPVTQRFVNSIRNELIEKISSVKLELKSDIIKVESNTKNIESAVHSLKSDVHRMAVLMEEQNNRNKITLDYLANLFERQDRLENKVDQTI